MDPMELTEGFTTALEAADFDTAASYLSDDFQFSSPMMPQPLNAAQWIGFTRALRAGVPDLSYNFRIHGAEGNVVRVSTQISGTHTGDLDMSGMGVGVIPATGKPFACAEEQSDGTVVGDKVVSIYIHATPETGLADMLRQIGVEMPSM